jgi:hypothetical protein
MESEDFLVWAIQALYVVVMAVGFVWMVQRIIRYHRYIQARRTSESMMAQDLSHSDFRQYLDGLRVKRANEESEDSSTKKDL